MSAKIYTFDSDDALPIIDRVKTVLNQQLSELMLAMFNDADDILFNLAESAQTNEDQNHYFDTIRLLRVERKTIQQAFGVALQELLQPVNKQDEPGEVTVFDEDELSLVDQDEMEEMVAISAMSSRAISLFGESINHLQARLEFLSLKTGQAIDKQALDPKHICESFSLSLKHLALSSNNRLIMNKLFEQQVLLRMVDVYQAINQLLIDEGVLPQIKLMHRHAAKKASVVIEQQESIINTEPGNMSSPLYQDPAAGYVPASAQSQSHNEIHRVINRFLTGGATASGPGIPGSFSVAPATVVTCNAQYYDRRDVVKALSSLQNRVSQCHTAASHSSAADFKRQLMADMSTRSGGAVTKQVSQVDEKTIDLIEMLFEAIIDDASISGVMTNLLLRMQTPVIKVAMLDQAFFSSPSHPARSVLNLTAQLGKGINQKDDPLYVQLETIVDEILTEFDVDIISFQQAVDQLNILINSEQEKTEIIEKQTQRTVLQEHARQVVLEELQYRIRIHEMPRLVHSLVLKHWSTLMFHRYIREGKNSESWNQAVTILSQLLLCLQAPANQQQWHALKSRQLGLIDSIRLALYATRQNRLEIDTAIDHLVHAFKQVLDKHDFSNDIDNNDASPDAAAIDFYDTAAFDKLPAIDAESPRLTPMEEAAELARDKVALLPAEVRPGVWFEIYNGEDSPPRRLKLSVIIMEDAELVFVDRLGVREMTKDAALFADELSQDKSRFIADHSIFDHALSHVISSLAAAS